MGNDDNNRTEIHKNNKHMTPIIMDILAPSFINDIISVNCETRIIARRTFLKEL